MIVQASVRINFLQVEVFTAEDLRAGRGPALIRCSWSRGVLVPGGGFVYAVSDKNGGLIAVGLAKDDNQVVLVAPDGDVVVMDQNTFHKLFAPV